MFPTTGKEFTRRVPDDFVPRSFLSGNSEERLEPGSGSHRAPSGSGASPGLPAPRGPAVLPPLPAGRSGNPEMEVPGPAGGASFRGRLQVPSTSPPATQRPSPHGAACVLTAWGSPRLVSVQAGAGRTCLGVLGSPRERTHLVERKGRWRAGSALQLGWVGGCWQLLRACALPFVLETSSVDEMRSWRASLGGTD